MSFYCYSSHIIAVCIYRYVITLGLRSKYDVGGHYCRFTPRILANPPQYDVTLLCYISQLYCMQTFNSLLDSVVPFGSFHQLNKL